MVLHIIKNARSLNANRLAVGSINSIRSSSSSDLIVGASDGVAYVVSMSSLAPTRLLTGADLMPVFATSIITTQTNRRTTIFTAASINATINKFVV